MKVALKFMILAFGIIAGFYAIRENLTGAGITSAGALIAYALIEIQDLKIVNDKDE